MIGKTVDFKIDNNGGFNTGMILDKYQGYKFIENASHFGKIKTCVTIDYYIIKSFEGIGKYVYLHIPCSEIINVMPE